MSLQRFLGSLFVLFFIANVIGICLEGNAAGDDTETSSATAAIAKAPELTKTQRAKIEKAQRDAWRKNIKEWKEWEPGEPADNSFCNVCHANLDDEKLVKTHMPEGVGCETCHGISDTHSEDEDSLVPPDVIFAKSRIVLFCTQCHSKDELIEAESDHKELFAALKKPQDSASEPRTVARKQKICTECHGFKHTLKNRTRRWNKETRKLQWYDGVRMMQGRDEGK